MMSKRKRESLPKSFIVVLGITLSAVTTAHSVDVPVKSPKPPLNQPVAKQDPGEWKRVVEAAKKEGKVVLPGDPSEVWRRSLVDLFQEEYPEIKVEYTGMNGRDFLPRLKQERALGKKLWDLVSSGTTTAYGVRTNGFLDPIRLLLVNENAENDKWIGGLDGLFSDKEKRFVCSYTIVAEPTTFVNRDFIKETELKSSQQLLDPMFKGKIVMQTPTAGATFTALGSLGLMYGENFLRDLLSKQNVVVTDDKRQQTEWLVRGRHPIAIGFTNTQLIPFKKQGLGKNIATLEDKYIPLSTGLGSISLLKDAPHPHAGRVYINWLLSQKTQIRLTRNVLLNSRRTDVPAVVKELMVDPAQLDRYFNFGNEENKEKIARLLPVIKEALQK